MRSLFSELHSNKRCVAGGRLGSSSRFIEKGLNKAHKQLTPTMVIVSNKVNTYRMYEGCSEIIETLAVNKLFKKFQVLFLVVR